MECYTRKTQVLQHVHKWRQSVNANHGCLVRESTWLQAPEIFDLIKWLNETSE